MGTELGSEGSAVVASSALSSVTTHDGQLAWDEDGSEKKVTALVPQSKAIAADVRAWLTEYFFNHPCEQCGESDPHCLCFIPREVEENHVSVGFLIAHGASIAEVEQKAAKSIIYCANCQLSHDAASKPAPTYKSYMRNKVCTPQRIEWYKELRHSVTCQKCGFGLSECVGFYYRDPTQRVCTISKAVRTMNDEDLQQESARCVTLCRNCYLKTVRKGWTVGDILE